MTTVAKRLAFVALSSSLTIGVGCSSTSSSGADAGAGTTDAGGGPKNDSGAGATGFGCSEGQDQCQCFDPPPSNAYAATTCTGPYSCCFTQPVGTSQECGCTNDDPCTLPTGATKATSCP